MHERDHEASGARVACKFPINCARHLEPPCARSELTRYGCSSSRKAEFPSAPWPPWPKQYRSNVSRRPPPRDMPQLVVGAAVPPPSTTTSALSTAIRIRKMARCNRMSHLSGLLFICKKHTVYTLFTSLPVSRLDSICGPGCRRRPAARPQPPRMTDTRRLRDATSQPREHTPFPASARPRRELRRLSLTHWPRPYPCDPPARTRTPAPAVPDPPFRTPRTSRSRDRRQNAHHITRPHEHTHQVVGRPLTRRHCGLWRSWSPMRPRDGVQPSRLSCTQRSKWTPRRALSSQNKARQGETR